MRLGQLARKLSIRQLDIVDFLAKNKVEIRDDVNAKLENEHVHLAIQHFDSSLLEIKEVSRPMIGVISSTEELKKIELKPEMEEPPVVIPIFEESKPAGVILSDEIIEVIKAPKIELQGLKVLGKIELPEPKSKEELVKEEVTVAMDSIPKEEKIEVIKPQVRKVLGHARQQPNRQNINPIALQRVRDARIAEENRKENAILEKERRTEYYNKRVKVNIATKAVRTFAEPVEEYKAPKKEKPTTIFGKIMDWLTNASNH